MTKVDNNYKRTEKALYDYKFLLKYIDLRKKDLRDLDYEGISATVLSLAKSSNSAVSDPVSNEYFNVEKVKETWMREINKNEVATNKVKVAIELLNNIERQIIELKYFECVRICDIANQLKYSSKQISRIKKNTVNKISIVLWGE